MRGILGSENSGNSILIAVSILMDIQKPVRVKKSCQWRMVSIILLIACCNGENLDSARLSSLTIQTLLYILGYNQQTYLHFVYDSVLAFAHALTRMQLDLCGESNPGMCPAMQPENIDGSSLLQYLENVSFSGT